MSTESDIGEIKASIAAMGKDVSEIKTGVAVIKTTSAATQGDIEEIKATLKNHDVRIRSVEVGLEAQKTRTDNQSIAVGTFSVIASAIAAFLGMRQ